MIPNVFGDTWPFLWCHYGQPPHYCAACLKFWHRIWNYVSVLIISDMKRKKKWGWVDEWNWWRKKIGWKWCMSTVKMFILLVFLLPSNAENVGALIYIYFTGDKYLFHFTFLFLFHCLVPPWLHTSSSTHLQALREKSHESAVLTSPPHHANCCPTEGLVSMPPNKSLVSVSWQSETLRPPRN